MIQCAGSSDLLMMLSGASGKLLYSVYVYVCRHLFVWAFCGVSPCSLADCLAFWQLREHVLFGVFPFVSSSISLDKGRLPEVTRVRKQT